MNVKLRKIEIDAKTADALETHAAARGLTVSEYLEALLAEQDTPPELERMRASGQGPWAPDMLAEDARRFADFERTGEGVPWSEVRAWMQSWGTPSELPPPKPRELGV